MKKVLILGANGFIGHHLVQRILSQTDWQIYAMDLHQNRLGQAIHHERMHFLLGDMTTQQAWISQHIQLCDVILPLVAIATPSTYVKEPLRVFELDFEANLPIVKQAVQHKKHLIFPSTSEVYGMCEDEAFNPDHSHLVYGPINKPRWIYACSKQLMDRIIWGYGLQHQLNFTLFRPFNWIGSGLDSIYHSQPGGARSVTQFLGHLVRGENIQLVEGGQQKRAFTDIDDGISALMHIIENKNGIASGKIYNIGNPNNNYSIREFAQKMREIALSIPAYASTAKQVQLVDVPSDTYYGKGYQDVKNRAPDIQNTMQELNWQPLNNLEDTLIKVFQAYENQVDAIRKG